MDHADHVALIRRGVHRSAGAHGPWADVGAGTGAFTLALADLLGSGARIIALDRDAGALRANALAMAARFPAVVLQTVVTDLADRLDLPRLDGIVAANSLHWIAPAGRAAVVGTLVATLAPGGRFIVVEYEADGRIPWLPDPLPFAEWEGLAAAAGLVGVERIGAYPGASGGGMYAALARVP